MKIVKGLIELTGKKVEIQTREFATALQVRYKGVVTSFYQNGQTSFIELDTGDIINTLYIKSITIIG